MRSERINSLLMLLEGSGEFTVNGYVKNVRILKREMFLFVKSFNDISSPYINQ